MGADSLHCGRRVAAGRILMPLRVNPPSLHPVVLFVAEFEVEGDAFEGGWTGMAQMSSGW